MTERKHTIQDAVVEFEAVPRADVIVRAEGEGGDDDDDVDEEEERRSDSVHSIVPIPVPPNPTPVEVSRAAIVDVKLDSRPDGTTPSTIATTTRSAIETASPPLAYQNIHRLVVINAIIVGFSFSAIITTRLIASTRELEVVWEPVSKDRVTIKPADVASVCLFLGVFYIVMMMTCFRSRYERFMLRGFNPVRWFVYWLNTTMFYMGTYALNTVAAVNILIVYAYFAFVMAIALAYTARQSRIEYSGGMDDGDGAIGHLTRTPTRLVAEGAILVVGAPLDNSNGDARRPLSNAFVLIFFVTWFIAGQLHVGLTIQGNGLGLGVIALLPTIYNVVVYCILMFCIVDRINHVTAEILYQCTNTLFTFLFSFAVVCL